MTSSKLLKTLLLSVCLIAFAQSQTAVTTAADPTVTAADPTATTTTPADTTTPVATTTADTTTPAAITTTTTATNTTTTPTLPVITQVKPAHYCLDGADNSFVSFTPAPGRFLTRNFTVALWVQTNETALPLFDIVGNRLAPNGGNYFEMRMTNTGQIIVELNQNTTNFNYANVTSTKIGLNDNNWHHVVFTRAGLDLSVYVDGALDNSATSTGVANITTTNDFRIGRSVAAVAGARFSPVACYGDLRVTWRAVSADEVANLFRTSTH